MIRFDPEKAQKEQIEKHFNEWLMLKDRIRSAHKHRKNKKMDDMLLSIALYEKLLVLVSKTSEFDRNDLNEYEVLPLNGVERFLFIIERPGQYAAFCQLEELFKETKKKIARLRN